VDGEVGILPKHEPYVTVLGLGEGRITTKDGSVESVAIIGGFVQVRPDRVLVLAESADLAAELDVAAIEKAKAVAEQALAQVDHADPGAVASARAAMARALLQLNLAERRRRRG
ncbi:MAG: ATP synthase F1 subunit epsilon, partial [Candidatus Limnocylindrus sp.]